MNRLPAILILILAAAIVQSAPFEQLDVTVPGWSINGTMVLPDASEINRLDGLTNTTANLNAAGVATAPTTDASALTTGNAALARITNALSITTGAITNTQPGIGWTGTVVSVGGRIINYTQVGP